MMSKTGTFNKQTNQTDVKRKNPNGNLVTNGNVFSVNITVKF